MNRTLMLIKPDACERNLIGRITSIVEKEGFKVINIKMERLSKRRARRFYAVHSKKDFFDHLIEYMTSGMTVGLLLERDNAIKHLREIVGNTDPKHAKRGTIRHKYGETFRRNSVHASDCPVSFKYEMNVFFKEK